MDIRNIRALKDTASQRLETAREEKKILLIYAGITIGASALVTILNYVLDLQIDQTGGLSNMGLRTILTTIQSVLLIVQSLALACLEMGFLAAMLRICRGMYTSPQTLRAGMPRFLAMVRCSLLQGAIYLGAILVSFYLSFQIYLITPLSNAAMEILTPLVSGASVVDPTILLDEATQIELTYAMIPMFVLFGVVALCLCVPISYQYRMANYILMDDPRAGALYALRESRNMMRHNKFALFRLDLSFWWYYGLTLLAGLVCYGDMLLPMLGVTLPWSSTVSYFVFYALFLVMSFGIYYFFLNRVNVTYALAYDSLRPRREESGGVVLGNIFDM